MKINQSKIKVMQSDDSITLKYTDPDTHIEYKVTYTSIYSPSKARAIFIKHLQQI